MNTRISKLINLYKNQTLLINNNKDLFYLINADFDDFWLLLYKKNIFIIVHEMIAPQIYNLLKKQNFKTKVFVTKEKISDKLIEVLKKYKIKNITIDTSSISLEDFDIIRKKSAKEKIKIIKKTDITEPLRQIKDKEEIKNIKKACDIVSEVFEYVKEKIVPGMTEIDVHFKIEEEFAKRHVIQSFKTIVASGPNSAKPHHVSSNRKIQKNDIVLIDMGCIYNGYCSDLTRTFFVGKEDKNKIKIWNIVKQAHDEALINVRPNVKVNLIDSFARNIIKKAGYENNFLHTTGHNLGLDIHEEPRISKTCNNTLKEGMIITIEPGIYLEKKFGVRIEDTVLVTKKGYKVLTSAKY